jgi:putative phosphoribosyl transferase
MEGREVRVSAGPVELEGILDIPEGAQGIVLFAHGSGSGRHSPRNRLAGATDWLAQEPDTQNLRVGYFGASTGAGAALVAAAKRPEAVGAVVSRGGRPDLAGEALSRVLAPTLLIVGGEDEPVIGMNREATKQIRAEKRLEVVPGATHLFEEPGKLEEVARLAAGWFACYLGQRARST